jgi:hypothetical protein
MKGGRMERSGGGKGGREMGKVWEEGKEWRG